MACTVQRKHVVYMILGMLAKNLDGSYTPLTYMPFTYHLHAIYTHSLERSHSLGSVPLKSV